MPHIPPLPVTVVDKSYSQKQKGAAALSRAAKEGRLLESSGDPLEDALRRLRYRLATGAPPTPDEIRKLAGEIRTTREAQNRKGLLAMLEKVTLPFDVASEAVSGVVGQVVPQEGFQTRSRASRAVLKALFSGEVDTADAAEVLREVMQSRSGWEQFITGAVFDPLNFVPGGLLAKGIVKTGLPGAKAAAGVAKAVAGPPLPTALFNPRQLANIIINKHNETIVDPAMKVRFGVEEGSGGGEWEKVHRVVAERLGEEVNPFASADPSLPTNPFRAKIDALFKAADPNPIYKVAIRLAVETAGREGEVGGILAGDINWEEGVVKLYDKAHKSPRTTVHLSPGLMRALEAIAPKGTPSATPLFPRLDRAASGAQVFNTILQEVSKAAGVLEEAGNPLKGNALRKLAATDLAVELMHNGVPLDVVSNLLGHDIFSSAMVAARHYILLNPDLSKYSQFIAEDETFIPLLRAPTRAASLEAAERAVGEARAEAKGGPTYRAKGRLPAVKAAKADVVTRTGAAILEGFELDPERIKLLNSLPDADAALMDEAFRFIAGGDALRTLRRARELVGVGVAQEGRTKFDEVEEVVDRTKKARAARKAQKVKKVEKTRKAQTVLGKTKLEMDKEAKFLVAGLKQSELEVVGRQAGRINAIMERLVKEGTLSPAEAEVVLNRLELAGDAYRLEQREARRWGGGVRWGYDTLEKKAGLTKEDLHTKGILQPIENMDEATAAAEIVKWGKAVHRLFDQRGMHNQAGEWEATRTTAKRQLGYIAGGGPGLREVLGRDFDSLNPDAQVARIDAIITQAGRLGVRVEPAINDAKVAVAARPSVFKQFVRAARAAGGGIGKPPLTGGPPPVPSDAEPFIKRFLTDKRGLEEIKETAVHPNPFAQKVVQMGEKETGKLGWGNEAASWASLAVRTLNLRGANAVGSQEWLLAHAHLVQMADDEAADTLRIVMGLPGAKWLNARWNNPVLPDYIVGGKELVKEVLPDFIRRVSGSSVDPYQAMLHQRTIFETIPVDQLERYYNFPKEVFEAIRVARAWQKEATAVAIRRGLKPDEVLKRVADPNHFAFMPADIGLSEVEKVRLMRGERGVGPIPAVQRSRLLEGPFWKKKREVPTAVEAFKDRVHYRNPFESSYYYVSDIQRYAADLELMTLLHDKGFLERASKYGVRRLAAHSLTRITEYMTSPQAAGKELLTRDVKRLIDETRLDPALLGDLRKVAREVYRSREDALRLKPEVEKIVARVEEEYHAAQELKRYTAGIEGLRGATFTSTVEANRAVPWLREGHKNFLTIFRSTNTANSMLRFMVAGLDLSTLFIHGMPLIASGRGKEWAEATLKMGKAIADPRVANQYLQGNWEAINEFRKYGGVVSFSEVTEGAQDVTSRLRRLGKGGRALGVVTDGMERAFSTWQSVARAELWQTLRPLAKTDSELQQLAAHVNKMTGVYNSSLAGLPELQRYVEGSLVSFASMYRRAAFGLLASVVTGQEFERKQAAVALSKMLGVLTIMFGVLPRVMGNNDKSLDPTSPQFMAVKVGNQYVGVGTAYYSLVRTTAAVIKTAANPELRGKAIAGPLSFTDNPMLRWWRSQAPPLMAGGLDMALGNTYIGDPLRGADGDLDYENVKTWGYKQVAPMFVESMIEQGLPTGPRVGMFGELLGFRAFPESVFLQRTNLRTFYMEGETDPEIVRWRRAQEAKGEDPLYSDMPKLLQGRLTERHPDLQELDKLADQERLTRGKPIQKAHVQYRQELNTNRRIVDERLAGVAHAFSTGKINAATFREEVRKQAAVLAALQETTSGRREYAEVRDDLDEAKLRRATLETQQFLGDHIFDLYFDRVLHNPANVNEDLLFVPEEFEKARQEFVKTFPGWVEYVDRRLKAGRTPHTLLEEYDKAKLALRPYWDLADTLWPPHSADWELVQHHRNKPQRDKDEYKRANPRLNYLLPRLEDAQDAFRRANPELDWLLVKWYDRVPKTAFAVGELATWEETKARLAGS